LDRGVWQSVSLRIDDLALQHDLLRKAGCEKQDENDDLDPIHITFSAFVLLKEIVEYQYRLCSFQLLRFSTRVWIAMILQPKTIYATKLKQ
jgi:hypothetical protein